MKPIVTADMKEKKDSRNKLIIGVVLVGLMILSTAGYAFFSGGKEEGYKKAEYKGVRFVLKENGFWNFKLQEADFLAKYLPQETENITLPYLNTAAGYSGKPLYFIGAGPARQEIEINLWQIISRLPQDGCIKEYGELCEEESPMKNCSEDNIIIIQEKEEIKVEQEENCVFIYAPYDEQTRAADAFIFKILGVRSA